MESSLMPVMSPEQENRMATSWLKGHAHRLRLPLAHRSQPQPPAPIEPANTRQGLSEDVDEVDEVDEFCQVIQCYSNETKSSEQGGGHGSVRFDIYGAHSWKEVVNIVQAVEKDYKHSATGWRGAARWAFRKLGEHSEDFNPWLDLLPDDKYFSIACGGLKIILGMAARRSEQREAILAFFAEIPEIIFWTDRYHSLFQDEEGLKSYLYEFYLALLARIQGMIAALVDLSLWRKIISGLRVKNSDKSLEHVNQRFTRARIQLDKHLQFVRDRLQVDTNQRVVHIKPVVDDLAMGQKKVIQQNSDLRNDFSEFRHEVMAKLERQSKRPWNGFAEQMQQLLQSEVQKAQWLINQENMQRENRQWQIMRHGYPKSDLYSFLGLNEQDVRQQLIQDLDDTGRDGQDIDMAAQTHAQQLLRMPRFQDWIRSDQPDMLHVDGNCDNYAMARCSPFSLLCCVLVHQLLQQPESQVLFFFCGLHNLAGEPMAGPVGLVKSLIIQLLLETDDQYDLFFLTLGRREDALCQDDLPTLCETLREMLVQNRSSALFCIVDGASLFEVREWREEMEYVVQQLFSLTTDPDIGTVFKVLFTSPGISRLASGVPQSCRVYVSETNERISDAGFRSPDAFQDEVYRRRDDLADTAGEYEVNPYEAMYKVDMYGEGCE
ncbi:hypothetical protein ASPBRDRAFT_193848 [Aspergillus brasiliensis CBS 101740]|uniref:Nephrocystin 3-like N-terminal domain-containing protein n=1 Tax=Aspergillus brasiliensis (strain CBS 101740 / IMI 381727 / IBT 21946) TaxID=767769 RepID=A0A1L9UU07_ASPBC|nr:hypothetical protein ASPBRDRAFT_193848 [Aspergillus brasiliensis CBS 101740]